MASNPDLELGEARAAIDRGDGTAALKRLDRARRGYFKQHDAEGLEHVLDMAALVDTTHERDRIGRENLAYATKQNLRQDSRRRAHQAQEPWVDPYPALQAPDEHTGLVLGRWVKAGIAVGVLLAIAAVVGIVLVSWLVDDTPVTKVSLRLVNDTQDRQNVRGCDDTRCVTSWMHRDIPAGLETHTEIDADELVTLFKLELPGPDECLPVRVHDGYLRLGGSAGELAVRLSAATPCPGTTVMPEVVVPSGV